MVKWSDFIRILRNIFPIKFYYHFCLANWMTAHESAASYGACALSMVGKDRNVFKRQTQANLIDGFTVFFGPQNVIRYQNLHPMANGVEL